MAANTHGLRFQSTQLDQVDFNINSSIRGLTEFTWEAWVKPGPLATNANMRAWTERQQWNTLDTAQQHKRVRFSVAPLRTSIRFSLARVDGTSPLTYSYTFPFDDDQWHHVAFVARPTATDPADRIWRIYIDGADLQSGFVLDGHLNEPISNTIPKWIHAGSTSTDDLNFTYWDGKIDNIRLWSTFRSGAQIAESMVNHLASPPGEVDLIEEWRFNEVDPGATVTFGIKNPAWQGLLTRSGAASSALFDLDRPFMGDGVLDTTAPSVPVIQAPTNVSTESFDITWTPATDNIYVQGYHLMVGLDAEFTSLLGEYDPLVLENGELAASVTGLSPNTVYFARVRAFDAANNFSDWSVYASPITTDAVGDVTAPTPPLATAATSVAQASFQANWNAATDDVGVAGYKLDVATDADFNNYVAGWRNRDVNNVLTFNVATGIFPSTTYYYRVRAYDAALNESFSSNTVTLQTPAPPDTTPPNAVVLRNGSSVEHDSFTANWFEGVDNVGVTGYRLDVSLDPLFGTFLANYTDLNVGNVTSYAVTNLTPNTTYYYRVRAYDAAGNISASPQQGEIVTTDVVLPGQGAPYSIIFGPSDDAEVREAQAASNFGSALTMGADGTSAARKWALLKLNLQGITGTITNALLNLYVPADASAATFAIQKATGVWDEATVTWDTRPSLTGDTVNFLPSAAGWQTIDIASLGLSVGEVTVAVFCTTTSADAATFNTKESTFAPYLEVTIDPQSASQIESVVLTPETRLRQNYLPNPSFEVDVTTGIASVGTPTITQNAGLAYKGTKSLKLVTDASGEGFTNQRTGLALTGQRYFGGLFWARAAAGNPTGTMQLVITYSDATTTTSSLLPITLGTQWRQYQISAITSNPAKTIESVGLQVLSTVAVMDGDFDCFLVEELESASALVGGYFDGSSLGGEWDSTTDLSPSYISESVIAYEAAYVGDENENNSVDLGLTYDTDTEAVTLASPTITRSTKLVTSTIGSNLPLLANLVENPSFENNLNFWAASGAGASIARVITTAKVGNASCAVTVDTTVGAGVTYDGAERRIFAAAGDVFQGRAWLKSPVGISTVLKLTPYDASDVALAGATSAALVGNDAWQEATVSLTCPANTAYVEVAAETTTTVAGVFNLDAVQVVEAAAQAPYIDGDQPGARWAGEAHASISDRVIEFDALYYVTTTLTDADGVFGNNPNVATTTIGPRPTTALTTDLDGLVLTPTDSSIAIECAYEGDDNDTSEAVIEWKRADLSTWSRLTTQYDRTNKRVRALLANLRQGTAYDIRVTFTEGIIYGPNPLEKQALTTIPGGDGAGQPTISFGGFVLQGPDDHAYWVSFHDALSHPSRRVQIEDMPRIDGGVELQNLWGTRRVNLRGGASGTSRDDLDQKIGALRKAFAPEKQRLIIDTLRNTGRFFIATCTSLIITETGGENYRHVRWDAEFECADPFRYDASETVENEVTMSNGNTISVTNSGDLAVDPTIVITTESAVPITLQLTNVTTGERIIPLTLDEEGQNRPATIESGDTLVIDTSRLSLEKNGFEIDYAGSFPRLVVGDNVLKMTVSPSAASVVMTIRRRHRYL